MTYLNKPVARKTTTEPAAHGVKAELVITLYPKGVIGIREQGRRSASEIYCSAAELYVHGIKQRVAAQRAAKRKARKTK